VSDEGTRVYSELLEVESLLRDVKEVHAEAIALLDKVRLLRNGLRDLKPVLYKLNKEMKMVLGDFQEAPKVRAEKGTSK
jgi:hypothetical protein